MGTLRTTRTHRPTLPIHYLCLKFSTNVRMATSGPTHKPHLLHARKMAHGRYYLLNVNVSSLSPPTHLVRAVFFIWIVELYYCNCWINRTLYTFFHGWFYSVLFLLFASLSEAYTLYCFMLFIIRSIAFCGINLQYFEFRHTIANMHLIFLLFF